MEPPLKPEFELILQKLQVEDASWGKAGHHLARLSREEQQMCIGTREQSWFYGEAGSKRQLGSMVKSEPVERGKGHR